MTEKSKYLLKIGFFWGLAMAVTTTALESWEKGDLEIFFSLKFAVKLAVFFVVGIGVGLFNWKEKQKAKK